METPGTSPPEGQLIEEAREARDLSQNRAAELAGISGTRWRQIVSGVASGGKGIQVPVHGRAKTVARMAQVVGVTPVQLADVGRRPDAADELRRLPPIEDESEPDIADLAARLERLEATAERQRQENAELRRMLREITGEDASNEGEQHRKAQ